MYTRADITKVFRLSADESETQKLFSVEHFYPNVCPVCLSHDRETHLKRCNGCKIISYCSKDHQKTHWPFHKDSCKAVSNKMMRSETNQSTNIFAGAFSNPLLQRGLISHFWDELEAILGRYLKRFEYEMISLPKVCEICRIADPDLLKACPNCPHANFCKRHEGDPKHKEICHLYILCFKMDIFDLVLENIPLTDTIIKITPLLTKLKRLPSSISEILKSYFKLKKFITAHSNKLGKIFKNVNFDLLRNEEYFEGFSIHITDRFTRSLTLLYAMEKLNFPQNEKMLVHVIGANPREAFSLSEWELVLHRLPYLKNLKVVFVGPEVFKTEILPMVCSSCTLSNKKLNMEFHCLLYETYVIESCHVTPDIVIGYNLGIANLKSWPDSIAIMKNFNCPLILTTLKEIEAYQDLKVVNSILGAETCLLLGKNPFASLRPIRYADVTGGFAYDNMNILIYKNFQRISSKIKLPLMRSDEDSKDEDKLSDLASSLSIGKFESDLQMDP